MVSYGVRILYEYRLYDRLMDIYSKAVCYIADIVLEHYDEIKDFTFSNQKQGYIEKLIHTTKDNRASYPFDEEFYKFPSYLRRSAITDAIGHVSSYKSNHKNWEESSRATSEPVLGSPEKLCPCLYNTNMWKKENDRFFIKVYLHNDWVWHSVSLKKSDLEYIRKNLKDKAAPVLEKHNRRYYLRFAGKSVKKTEAAFVKDIYVDTVVSADLGVNTDAVCSAVRKDGTVTARTFIDDAEDKDRLFRICNEMKKANHNGNKSTPRLWAFAEHYNTAIEIHTAIKIVEFAVKNNAQVIVFENLKSFHGRTRNQKIHLWRKRTIQRRVESMAALYGIRVSYICPKNTSALAFDGSGKVVRSKDNYSLCTFTTGKQYNCDLSASYNIAARYFIRVIQKTTDENQWSDIAAKVPELSVRTNTTLSSLISLTNVMQGFPCKAA